MIAWFKDLVIRWKLVYVYTIFLVLLSILPINSSDSSINHSYVVHIRLDYLLHCLVYIPLVVLIWIDKDFTSFTSSIRTLGWIIILLLFAAVTEWIQHILPYRAFNINDLIANVLGVMVGIIIMISFKLRQIKVYK